MLNENVFFGDEGLTSTSANFYANIAQETIQAIIEKLNNVRFYQVFVASIGSDNKQLMTAGQDDLSFINNSLTKCAKMNSFCAWIREAIKKKEEMAGEISAYSFDEWAKEHNIELPKEPTRPIRDYFIGEEDVINSWDINKRNKYLKAEAFASTYGKYIHPKGAFSKARKEVHSAVNNPIYKEGSGRDLILYYQEPTINVEEIDNMFMTLQDVYRSYEKTLNAMKAEIKEVVNKTNIEIDNKFVTESNGEYKKAYQEYYSKMEELRSQFSTWKLSENERISKLKIVLPKDLLEVFEEIKKQGSK